MNIKTFWCPETNRVQTYLRRYSSADVPCPATGWSIHDAMIPFAVVIREPNSYLTIDYDFSSPSREDPRWPSMCSCGYEFLDTDERQLFRERIMVRSDTGEEFVGRSNGKPVGAVWNAWWESNTIKRTSDGRSLWVQTPGGEWGIDQRASNCDMPNENTHFCWCRHGSPETGDLHVDKIGHTCGAGAGSIALPKWHGFLDHGYLKLNRD